MFMPTNEIILDPLDLDAAADAWAARAQAELVEGVPAHDAVELDPVEAKHAAELDRIVAPPIKASDPAFEQLASDRRAAVYAHLLLLPAVGADPDDGFIEPEPAETYVAAPKVASAFAVESPKRRRPKYPKSPILTQLAGSSY
jgi:hypothetical protein